MTNINEQLREQEEAIRRIRQKRKGKHNTERMRKILNIVFLGVAAVGCLLYFALPENRLIGMAVIAIGMVLKVVELFLRFMF